MTINVYEEFVALTRALDDAAVDYAPCGALALVHGAPRATKDIEIVARRDDPALT